MTSELAQQTVIASKQLLSLFSFSFVVHWPLRMHEDVKCFDPLPVTIQLERRVVINGVLLGFSELFREFYAAEVYSEVAKMFRRVYTHTYGGPK